MILFYRLMDKSVYSQPNMVSDYQMDCVYHGLKILLENKVDEFMPSWWMLRSYKEAHPEHFKHIWGKGFSVYGLLPDSETPLDEMRHKLYHKIYDKIIVGIHHTKSGHENDIVNAVDNLKNMGYSKSQIIVIDGWDREWVCRRVMKDCLYFKREHDGSHHALPISFAIPEEKIVSTMPVIKDTPFSEMIPAMFCWDGCEHIKSYKYNDEDEYYKQYQRSYFAYTCKKAGWDCMRHYEILANGCVPWFTDIEQCPSTIMTNFPKDICIEAKKLQGLHPGTIVPYDPMKDTYLGDTRRIKSGEKRGTISEDFDFKAYYKLRERFLDYTRANLTTTALAKYILSF